MDTEATDNHPQPSPATPSALADLHARQDRMRDNIADMQHKIAERHKPWYKQGTTLMSIAGTIFAILSGVYSNYSGHIDSRDKNISGMMTAMTEISQLELDDQQDAQKSSADPAGFAMRSAQRLSKRLALLELAQEELKAVSYNAPPTLLTFLGTEFATLEDYSTAHDYLLRAVKNSSPHSQETVSTYLKLAQICIGDGKAFCGSEGQQYYLEAIEQQPDATQTDHYEKGQLYALIGGLLMYNHVDLAQAEDYFNKAAAEDAQLIAPLPKQNLQQFIQVNHNAAAEPGKTPAIGPAPASAASATGAAGSAPHTGTGFIAGRWQIIDAKNPKQSGTATFIQMPGTPFYSSTLEFYQGNMLIERQSGQVMPVDAHSMQMDWQSTNQTTGTTKFSLDPSRKKVQAVQYPLHLNPTEYILQK